MCRTQTASGRVSLSASWVPGSPSSPGQPTAHGQSQTSGSPPTPKHVTRTEPPHLIDGAAADDPHLVSPLSQLRVHEPERRGEVCRHKMSSSWGRPAAMTCVCVCGGGQIKTIHSCAVCVILQLSAEDDVDAVLQRPVLLRDGKPRLPAHDHHILPTCRTSKQDLI